MPKKQISLKDLINQIQQNYAECDPSDAYFDCEEEHGEIEGTSAIWRLVEDAMKYAVEQTIDHLGEYEIKE